jgi:hypothetical protein
MTALILVLAYSALFIQVIRRNGFFRLENIPTTWLQIAFLAKVIAGSCLGWLYFSYYHDEHTGDTIKFFRDSEILFNTIHTNPRHFFMMFTGIGGSSPELRHYYESMSAWLNNDVLFNDNKTIIRLNTLFRFLSCGQYYVHVVFINFISFTGLICLFKLFSKAMQGGNKLYFIVLFFYPSLLLWGSGLLKDGLLLFALGVLLLHFDYFISGERGIIKMIALGFSMVLLLFTKFYVIAAVFPGLLAWHFSKQTTGTKTALIFLLTYCIFIFIGFNIYRLYPVFDLAEILYWKQHNFFTLANITGANSAIPIPELEHGSWSVMINAPGAFFRSLLRPGLTDNLHHPFILMAAIENAMMMLFFIILLVFFRIRPINTLTPLQAFCLAVTIVIFTLIGLITPILGALVRYKVVVFPFLAYAVMKNCDTKRILR